MASNFLKFILPIFFIYLFENVKSENSNGDIAANPYWHREMLDTRGQYYLEWLVDWTQEKIIFNVTCATRGYVGFGISPASKMEGADIIIGGVYPNGTQYFSDRHATGEQKPVRDPQQNWVLHFAKENQTHTFLTFSRSFDTCDSHDVPITDNSIFLLWAFGELDNEEGEYHNSSTNRGTYVVHLKDIDFTPQSVHQINQRAIITGQQAPYPAEVNGAEVWTLNERYTLPPKRTTYWCTLKKFSSPVPAKYHVIGYNIRMNQEAITHLHHLIIHRCIVPKSAGVNASQIFEPLLNIPGQDCYAIEVAQGPIPTPFCTQVLIGHGVGGRPQFFPFAGIPIGETGSEEYFVFQAHYDNQLQLPNITTDIKLDLYYTSQLRSNDISIMSFGHIFPGSPGVLIPPGEQNHKIFGHCSESCTRKMIPPQGIKLIGAFLHTHLAGKGVTIRHYRNGKELPWVAYDNNYQFYYQKVRIFREEKNLLPGDQISVECEYQTQDRNTSLVGGYGTDQEMCLAFVLYYNSLRDFPVCLSELISTEYMQRHLAGTNNITWSYDRLENLAVSPPHVSGMTISEISDSRFVNWDTQHRSRLQLDHMVEPQTSVCPSLNDQMRNLILGNKPEPEYVNLPIQVPEYRQPTRCDLNG